MKAAACAVLFSLGLLSLPAASADGPCEDPLATEPCYACLGIYSVSEGMAGIPAFVWFNKYTEGAYHTGLIVAESGDGEPTGKHASVYFVGIMTDVKVCPPKVNSPSPTALYWLWMVERMLCTSCE